MKPFLKEQKEKEKAKTLNKNNKSKNPNKNKIQAINHKPIKHNFEENDFIIPNNNLNENNESNDFETKKILDDLNNKQSTNENTISNKNNADLKNDFELNNNVIDLRMNLENQLLEEIKNKNNNLNNNPIQDEVNDKISTIKRFRNYRYFPDQTQLEREKKKKKEQNNKKFSSKFERRRFIKALKNIITERLGEHNIYIQNICSCGNLQKQFTALIEKGNLTVYALTEVECANNCVFYKNKKEYLKNINDVLNSIKDISFDNFHNKYKEQK